MKVIVDVGEEANALLERAAESPARVNVSLVSIALVSGAGAYGLSDFRAVLIGVAALAMAALVAIGSRAAAVNEVPMPVDPARDIDAVSRQRDDPHHYRNLAHLNADTRQKWAEGRFADPVEAEKYRTNFLEGMLASEAARLEALGLRGASILVVRHEDDEFLVRRIGGPLKARLSRGDRCSADCDLTDALQRYAPYSKDSRVSCCGRYLAIAATAEVAFNDFATAEVARIALFYQTAYERLRLLEGCPPPLTKPSEGLDDSEASA
jgi:hypothetical protein